MQPHRQQRGRPVPDGRGPLQLLQPQLPPALHPGPDDQQLGPLQLRPLHRGPERVEAGLPRGHADVLRGSDEHHRGTGPARHHPRGDL